ncbi:hypothetical protein WDU94_009664 [Cyamophila willieti]
MYANELIPLPPLHDDNLVAISLKCNQEESESEPLSGLLGSSLNTLFNTSINVPPENHASPYNCIQSTSITSHLERSSSPIFAQDCPSQNTLLEIPLVSKCIECTPVLQTSLEDVPVVSSYYTLSMLPESGITSLTLPTKESSRSSPSSSSGFSSASTDELQQFEDNDVFESSVVRSEESFSSVTSSKSNSDEETPSVGKNLSEINIDNIVLSCLFCDKIFASIKSTKTHMLKSHQANETHWECVFCKINFKNCDLLLNHLCSNHSDVYFACISCKVRFDSKAFMDTHFQIKHNSENDTKCVSKYSESKNKDDILHQLKCIPYYTNQNVISNSLSRKMKMHVFDKLNSSKKKYNQKRVTNKSVQVTEDDISQECNRDSMTLNSTASILKRKLTEDHPVSHRHSTRSKIIKMSKAFVMDVKEKEEESILPAKSPCKPSSEENVPVEIKSVSEEFAQDLGEADKEMKTEPEEEIETNDGIEVLCLFCNKISSSEKGSKAHVARIHKMRRGGKICCYCRSNFRTLDLLFNHLCSNHSQVYFACTFCKARFNGKSSLLIHFESHHNSVNINTDVETVKENSDVVQKELFMFGLKCLPTYSSTPVCSSNCNTCEREQDRLQEESKLDKLDIAPESSSQEITIESELFKEENEVDLVNQNPPTPQLTGMESDLSKDTNQMESVSQKPGTQLEISTESDLSKDNNILSLSNHFESKEAEVTSEFLENMDSSSQEMSTSSANESGSCLDSSGMSDETLENSRNQTIDEYWKERFCLYCDRIFEKGKAYRVHLFRSHKAKKNKCMFCESIFSFHEELFSHLESTHKEIYFACRICKMRFDTESSFANHFDQYHNLDQNSEGTTEPSNSSQNKIDGLETKEVNSSELNTSPEISGDQKGSQSGESIDHVELEMNGPIQPMETIISRQAREASMVMQTEDESNQNKAHVNRESKCLDVIEPTNEPTNLNEFQKTEVTEPTLSEDVNATQCREVKSLLDHLISDVEVASNCVPELQCAEIGSNHMSDASLTKSICSTSKTSLEPLLRDQELFSKEDSLRVLDGTKSNPTVEATNGLVPSVPKLTHPNTPIIAAKYKTQNPRQLINYSHPEYENIAQRNYSQLDITVQIQILDRVKNFTKGKLCTAIHPSKRPQRQQKPPGNRR